MATRYNEELQETKPWRKHGFIVKPYYGNDPEDAKRFYKQLPRALEEVICSDEWTAAQVLSGYHEGGSQNPLGGGRGAAAAQRRSDARKRQVFAKVTKHILNPALVEKYDSLKGPGTARVEDLWDDFRQNECGGDMSHLHLTFRLSDLCRVGELGAFIAHVRWQSFGRFCLSGAPVH